MNINKSLDHYMGLNGFSQADVCKESELSPASISLIRNGHRSPSLKTMVILAELFQVKLPEDEPLMIFRGKDIGSLVAIVEYISMLEEQTPNNTIHSHLKSSLERLNTFYLYQVDNPKLQSIGCSRKSHDSYSLFLKIAKSKLIEHGFNYG